MRRNLTVLLLAALVAPLAEAQPRRLKPGFNLVALRHGTNQDTKANFLQLAAMLAGRALGSDSLLSQLGQLGIGLGANSVFLKFPRSAETDADLLGARIMAGAGYNPVEMARFFQKKVRGEGNSAGFSRSK